MSHWMTRRCMNHGCPFLVPCDEGRCEDQRAASAPFERQPEPAPQAEPAASDELVQRLRGSCQHDPSAKHCMLCQAADLIESKAEPAVTEVMVTAYLTANDAYWKRIDGEPTKLGKWRNGTPSEATRVSLAAALAAAPQAEPAAARCHQCGSISAIACNGMGCFALEGQDDATPEPASSEADHFAAWLEGQYMRFPTAAKALAYYRQYGAALASAPHAREPLSEAQILAVLDVAKVPELPDGYQSVDVDIARAIERAHGIG